MIVSNTSPIIFLAKLNKLNLLFNSFGLITLPEEVYDELQAKKTVELEYIDSCKSYFEILSLKNKINLGLDPGETAVISLAVQKKAKLIILDDHAARLAAESLHLESIGTLGILLLFLEKKLITLNEFKTLLHQLINNNFRISIEVYNEVLMLAEKLFQGVKK